MTRSSRTIDGLTRSICSSASVPDATATWGSSAAASAWINTCRLTVSSSTTRTGPVGTVQKYSSSHPAHQKASPMPSGGARLAPPPLVEQGALRRPTRARRGSLRQGLVGLSVRDTTSRCPADVPLLDQEGLNDVFQGVARLGQCGSEGIHTHRAAIVVVDDHREVSAVHLVETGLVHFEPLAGFANADQIHAPR